MSYLVVDTDKNITIVHGVISKNIAEYHILETSIFLAVSPKLRVVSFIMLHQEPFSKFQTNL